MPVRQRVVFHPWLLPLVNRVSHAVIRQLLRVTRYQPTLIKAEGMLRFYLNGKLPIDEQPIPEGLCREVHQHEAD
jgi:hypothetical protein